MTQSEVRPDGTLASSVDRMRRELDRWWDVAVSSGGKALDAIGLRGGGKPISPPVDVIETDDEVHVYVDLPGVQPQTVDVSIAGNMLTIRGELPALPIDDHTTLHTRERLHGEFARSLPMPTPVDPETVAAESRDGVLRVTLGKAERARTRQIPVSTGG